jgi:hypothetical protein
LHLRRNAPTDAGGVAADPQCPTKSTYFNARRLERCLSEPNAAAAIPGLKGSILAKKHAFYL